MLELYRKPDETLLLFTSDGVVKIHVRGIEDQQVQIDLDIPRSVTLLRDDVLDKQIKASYRQNEISLNL